MLSGANAFKISDHRHDTRQSGDMMQQCYTPHLYSGHERESLFLRSAKSLAARIERKHEWAITTSAKRTDLSGYTQSDLDKVALRLI
jgi:hypothetical protein